MPKPLLVWQVSEPWHQLCFYTLNTFCQILVSPVEWSLYKVSAFNMGVDKSIAQQMQS